MSVNSSEDSGARQGPALSDQFRRRIEAATAPPTPSRQVRLHVRRVGVWTVTKNAIILGVLIGIITIIAVFIAWSAYSNSGGLQSLDTTLTGSASGSGLASITKVLNTKTIMGFATLIAILQVVGTVVAGVIGALAYNAFGRVSGGILFGFESA